MKQLQHHPLQLVFERRIVARPFVAHKGMGAIHLDPLEVGVDLVETRLYLHATLQRNMRILPSPDVQQLALDFAGTRQ